MRMGRDKWLRVQKWRQRIQIPVQTVCVPFMWMPLGNAESHLSLYSSYELNNKAALVGNLSRRIILNSTGEGNRKPRQYLSSRTIMIIDILKKPKLWRKP